MTTLVVKHPSEYPRKLDIPDISYGEPGFANKHFENCLFPMSRGLLDS
ncbi:uncharacterized protein G2W53_026558 [Senna tora]|uniref:Uncharacterized protein n=1 Tax=Senna tora TaxID=362788 RepID=A0A834WHJ2_9FABA|nr:uncharacterized protein G2W53_026558 [Senna tora]